MTTPAPAPAHAAPDPADAIGGVGAAPAPAAPNSPLGSLRAARAKLQATLHVDLRVPRWGDDGATPLIYVRYKPAAPSQFQDRMEKLRKQAKQKPDWAIIANAQMLVGSCIGVFAIHGEPLDTDPLIAADDPRPRYSLRDGDEHGDWTKFDPDLAHSLGMQNPDQQTAINVCRALYLTEPDLTAAGNRLMRWSGANTEQDDQSFFGG